MMHEPRSRVEDMGRIIVVAAVYAVAGKLALLLAIPPGYATAVWPAAGLALAGILFWGYRVWPGILVGSFLANVWNSFDASTAISILWSIGLPLCIGAGAALQAVVGARLIRRFVKYPDPLDEAAQVVKFLVLGGPISCLVSPTIGVAMLWMAGVLPSSGIAFSWWTWWTGDAIGALVFAPAAVVFLEPAVRISNRRRMLVCVPLGVAFAAVVGLFFVSSRWEQRQIKQDFDRRTEGVSNSLANTFADYLDVVYSIEGLYHSSIKVRKQEFLSFVQQAFTRHAGIQALEWIPRVPASRRSAFERTAREDGNAEFRIWERSASGQSVEVTARPEYFPVYFVEPLAGNEKALGFDLASEPTRLDALTRAAATGEPAATGRIQLVQESQQSYGFLVFQAVRKPTEPSNALDAPPPPIGFALAVFKINDMVQVALKGTDAETLEVQILDESASQAERLLYDGRSSAGSQIPATQQAVFERIIPVEMAGRRWALHFTPSAEQLLANRSLQSWSVLAGGMTFAGMLGAFLLLITGRTAQIEHLVTERTNELSRANELLQASEHQFRLIIDTAHDAIIALDSQGRITEWNPQAVAIFGWTRDEALGRGMAELIIPRCQTEDNDRGIYRFLTTGEGSIVGKPVEITALRRNGAEFPVELIVARVRVAHQWILTAFARDISERKSFETELAAARDAALESARLKSEFLANMSHEIRTPMNGVVGMVNLLLDTKLTPEQKDYSETISQSADALLTIINDILDFSKIEAGKLTFETIDFDLWETTENAVGIVAESAQAKGIQLVSLVNRDVPTMLRGDPGRLRQVLTNLLSNGVKFTAKGEVVLRVSKEAETNTHAIVRVAVTDTGIGIAPAVQKHLFQVFTQADGSTTRTHGGTGLGLAICKQLVERMGGQISIESAVGQGSTFWFTVRLEKQASSEPSRPTPEVLLDGLRVLIVDDHPANRRILSEQLRQFRMCSDSAASGSEALSVLRRAAEAGNPYTLAILDHFMPEFDGLALAKTIKADPSIDAVRLIMMSSSAQRLNAPDMASAGLDDYLVKPVKQSSLLGVLEKTFTKATPSEGRVEVRSRPKIEERPIPVAGAKTLQILIAEDNVINQKVTLNQLGQLGYSADLVGTGAEALKALERIPYDIILMDCQMPEMDGYEATRQIRARGSAQPYVVALTAHAMPGDREKCLAAGMNDYLTKPLKTVELAATLDRAKSALASPKNLD